MGSERVVLGSYPPLEPLGRTPTFGGSSSSSSSSGLGVGEPVVFAPGGRRESVAELRVSSDRMLRGYEEKAEAAVRGLEQEELRTDLTRVAALADARAASTLVSWTTGRRRPVVSAYPWHKLSQSA